jgi:hypothetical protein
LRLWRILAALAIQGAVVFFARTSSAFLLGFPVASIALVVETKGDFETIASELNRRGIKAHAPAAIVGKSGVKHEFAFALVPDSGKARVVVDTELSVRDVDEMKVLKFYVKVFDVGPEKAVLCVSPRLGTRAATLAKEYGIIVLEDDVPRKLIPMAAKVVNEFIGLGGN